MNEYDIIQLTDNDIDDRFAEISGNNVVWEANDGNDNEIFLYDGDTVSQLTDNQEFDTRPYISGSDIVWLRSQENWRSNDFVEREIILYDGANANSLGVVNPVPSFGEPPLPGGFPTVGISEGNVVWGDDTFSGTVFYYDGNTVTELTNSGLINPSATNSNAISGNRVVWTETGEPGTTEIFLFDGTTITQIVDDNLANAFPSVSGNSIAWESADLSAVVPVSNIFFNDGTTTTQLTDDDLEKSILSVSEGNVIWATNDGLGTSELFLYDGTNTIKLSNDIPGSIFGGFLSGDKVAWAESDGNDSEIYLYDGNTTIQITDNDVDDEGVDIDGNNLVWQRSDGNDVELFLATPNNANSTSQTTVYRFFNNDTGVHFYTADEIERDAVQELPNFSFEGESYQAVDPLTGNPEPLPIYRFLNEDTGVHLYTISEVERDATQELSNFSFEGEAFSAYATEVNGSIPIYRFFNPTTGAHFYTPSETERDNVETNLPDFQSEGIAYYALPVDAETI